MEKRLILGFVAWTCLASAQRVETLPGTAPLDWQGDLSARMMDGAHRFIERKIAQSRGRRKLDAGSRRRFSERIGVVDPLATASMERFGDETNPALVAETRSYRVFQVRWTALEGVHGEGLLLEPKRVPVAFVVALPDAGQTPEETVVQFAHRFAEAGCSVVVPALVDRETTFSGHPEIRMTDQPHREWIYRQAYHMGRHIIGYEVQKVRGAAEWFRKRNPHAKVGVAGYAEGGLIAFYSAAVDERIDAALVSGYFDARERVWAEPIYRNVWGLLDEFGDAGIASLIAPRGLVVEASRPPEWKSVKGDIPAPELASVRAEFDRIGSQAKALVEGGPWSSEAMQRFAAMIGMKISPAVEKPPSLARPGFDYSARQMRQVKELEAHVQGLVRASEHVRAASFLYKAEPRFTEERWSTRRRHDTIDPAGFIENAKPYREQFWTELMGRFDDPLLAPNPRTRKIFDNARWKGYEVVLDVWPDVFSWGVLLVPNGIRLGERRPVVVCQHGRGGVPRDVIEGNDTAYGNFAAELADRGYVVFAPHNLYRGEDRYRWLCRKANTVKGTLFTFIIHQHDQILRWLETLPFVDGQRMAFYGLSYGGETAMRVPAVLEKYALSICSGDFNQWTWKVASTDERFSFMYTIEWEMPYFNLGSTFDYAEMAYLIFPRPFMVERGHHDLVGRDRWVAYEYAKVRWLYAQFNLPERTAIEFFNGGHAINAEGTFRFLDKHLRSR